jgi:hypothetical protein
MQYRSLGRTGIKVSPYALGAMLLGSAIGNPDHDDSIRIIHKALDAGINFVDTADAYSIPPHGASEIVVAVGGYHVYKGVSRNFLADLKGTPSDLVRRLGLIGYTAKGLVIGGAGMLVIIAASLSQPDKATGLDGALKTLGAQPYGAILLSVAGLGIIAYGLYSFAMARYTKM